jgi:GntR family transcriptional regulator
MAEIPRYREIADDLQQRIEAGEFTAGKQLPTEPKLQEQYGDASRNTVRDAIKLLVSRGFAETKLGKGTFVVDKIDPFVTVLSAAPGTGFGGGENAAYLSEVTENQREPSVSAPKVEIQEANAKVARELQIEPGTQVVLRHQLRSIDHQPWSMQTSWYPMAFVTDGAVGLLSAKDIPDGIVKYLKDTLAIEQVGYEDLIVVRQPDSNEIGFFKLPADGRVAVVEQNRTAFDKKGRPLRLTVTVFPADRNQFVFRAGRLPEEITNRPEPTKSD